MTITALVGGTGFTGRRVAARLAHTASVCGGTLRCLVRPESDRNVLPPGVGTVVGDLADPGSLDTLLDGAGTLVYTASMGFGHVPAVLDSCRRQGVARAVFVSTTAIFTRLPAPSLAVRTAAEEAVRGSGLAWTILRPTMIYGAPGDRNMERLLRALVRWPLLVIPGDGQALVQPVHVEDLADGIAAAAACDRAVGRAYDLSGREPLSFDAAVGQAAEAVARPGRRLHLPLLPVTGFLRCVEAVGLRLPVRREQVLRLAEDKAFPWEAAETDLGFAPRSFHVGIREEARLLGLAPETTP